MNHEDIVCIPRHVLIRMQNQPCVCPNVAPAPYNIESRDRAVLNDSLHPPLNRSDMATHVALRDAVMRRNLYVPTQLREDRYRLVGYLVSSTGSSEDVAGGKWKLFATEHGRPHRFYMSPVDNRVDMKIAITDKMIVGSNKLRDVWTIPDEITFQSPVLSRSPYKFVELPKNDFTTDFTGYM